MVESHASLKFCNIKLPTHTRRDYLTQGFTEKTATDSKGEQFSYWYKATGSTKPKTQALSPKVTDNEVVL